MVEKVPRIPVYWYSLVSPGTGSGSRHKFYNMMHCTRTCPFCRVEMRKVEELSGKCTPEDYVVICGVCGFWFGRGYKWNEGPDHLRCAMGLISYYSLDDLEIPTTELVKFLNKEHAWITHINPYKAEKLICKLLEDAFGWEVKHVGGRKDGGVDALAILSDAGKTIIQVKLRRNTNRAESVSTVRELAGTLLARGVPRGMIVTTSKDLSSPAKLEANTISQRDIRQLGRIDISWKSFSDILDMLQIASQRVDKPKRVYPHENLDDWVFDHAGIWDGNNQYIPSRDLPELSHITDPYELIAKTNLQSDL